MYANINRLADQNSEKIAKELGLLNTDHLLEMIQRSVGLGSNDSAFSEAISGYNMLHQGIDLPMNRELQGHIFVTRPCLNLTDDNIARVRELTQFYSRSGKVSWLRAIRDMLDPISAKELRHGGEIFDTRQAFLPILTNLCISSSGWPDRVGNTYATERGIENETWIMNDGGYKIYSQWEMSMTLENIVGNPAMKMAETLAIYQGAVYMNRLMPHFSCLMSNEIDYTMRMYRIMLEPDGETISGFSCNGGMFLSASNIGSMFNYTRDSVYNEDTKQVSLQFDCVGAIYNDPYYMRAFNLTATHPDFNPDLADGRREQLFVKINPDQRKLFNYKCFPYINTEKVKLEWWMDKEEYTRLLHTVDMMAANYRSPTNPTQQRSV